MSTNTSSGTAATATSSNGNGGKEAFCLRRSDHGNDLIRDFSIMLEDEDLIDVTLSCEDGSIGAHRLMLSANSPYFKSLFARLAASSSKTQYPVVVLKDLAYRDLKAIIEFIYRGEVTVPQKQLTSVLRSAESLKIRGLNGIEGVSEDGSLSRNKKKRKKRRRRISSSKTSNDEEQQGSDEEASSGQEESGNELTADDDFDLRTHITRVSDVRSNSTSGDLEPTRLLEQTMTVTDQGNSNNPNAATSNANSTPVRFHPPTSSNGMIDASILISQLDSINETMAAHHASTSSGLLGFDSHVPSLPGPSGTSGHSRSAHPGSGGGGRVNQGSHQCPYCMKAFEVRYSLIRHIRVIHDPQRHVYVCNGCGHRFNWKSAYQRHSASSCNKRRNTMS